MAVTHSKVSAATDSADTNLVRPSDWNDDHVVVPDATFPGYEIDYVEITTNATATATTEGTANTLISGNAIAYDGSTRVKIECWFPWVVPASGTVHNANLILYDGSSSIGAIDLASWNPSNPVRSVPVYGVRYLTPSAATHTYSVRGYVDSGTATWVCGTGGSANVVPAFLRITKA